MDGHFCTRTLFFLQATMGLGFVGVGLVNLVVAEDDGAYDHRCSSLKDQTILWMGVVVVCSSSLGLMTSFWPESKPSTDDATQIEMPRRSICCCCKNGRRTYPSLLEESAVEPLLSDEEGQLAVFDDDNQSTVSNGEDEQQPVVNREKATEPSSRIRGTSRLLKLAGKQSLYLWVGIVVLLIRLPFSLAIPHFVSTTIGSLINADYDGAKRSVLMLFLLGTIDSILDFWCIFLFGYAKENIVKGVRIDTFASIVRQEQAFFDQSNTGDLISRLTSDCGEMAGDLTWFFRFSVEAAVRITGISTYMILRSPFLGLCTVGIVPVVGVINKLYGDWLAKNAQAVQNSLAEATTSAHESLACIQTVITSASEEHECEKYTKKVNTMYALNIRQMIATGIYFMVVSTFLINTCVQAALLLLGSHFVQQGKLTPEVLLAFMLYQGQLQEYTLNLFQSYSSLIKSSGAGDRVFYLLDRHPPAPGTGNESVKSLELATDEVTTDGDITLQDVTFAYPTRPETLALNRCSLEIKSGSIVALVGHSGCGKSTIISLLERLYDPDQGSIVFGEVNLRVMNLKAHREKIVRENIGYGASATFDEIVEAAKVANAHSFINSFPNTYDEDVGERGMNLSGGQRQRLVIARALIRKPSLLLLDEATSALDPESEAAVQEALNELLQHRAGMTTIIIAHRLQTVRNADTIVVIKKGAVVEQGSHAELVRNEQGPYRRMVDRADSMGILPET
eukprot:scaffold1229_cov193-Alexandrium_tamarense.AAC.26